MCDDMNELVHHVHELEQQGMELSYPWFRFETAEPAEINKLKSLVYESRNSLSELSIALDERLKQELHGNRREQLQHAFNLVQELLTSRSAVYDTIVLSEIDPHPEFLRAVAIKEKAAYDQARKLIEVMTSLY
jgi:hypothetical protein